MNPPLPNLEEALDGWRRRIAAAGAKGEVRALLADAVARVSARASDEARFDFVLLALATAERDEVLQALPLDAREQLAQTVPFLLQAMQAEPRARTAKKHWFLIKARRHRKAGEWLAWLQAAEIAVAAESTPSADALLELCEALIRLGRPQDALRHLSTFEAPQLTRKVRWHLGLPKEAAPVDKELMQEGEWYAALEQATRQQNPIPLLRKLGRGSTLKRHDRLLLASFLVLATKDREAFAGLPGQRGLKELLPENARDGDGWRLAADALFELKALLEQEARQDDGLKIAALAETAKRLPQLELEAALLAGAWRLGSEAGLPALERILADRYAAACSALTGGRTEDLFEVRARLEDLPARPRTLPKDYFSLGAQLKRMASVTSSLLGTTANGWLKQAFASSDQVAGLKDRQLAEYAATLRDFFADAKGVMQKLTQVTEFVEYAFPKQVSSELYLARRQQSAPLEPRLSRQIVEEDFGRPLADVFAEWEDLPIAAASIGQVHRARLKDGTEVAVKVKFPRMEGMVKSQLRLVGMLAPLLEYLYPTIQIKRALKAGSAIFLKECDYELEVQNQLRFGDAVKGLPGIFVPRPFRELCTARVITMELARGTRFYDFVTVASEDERNRAGALIFEALMHAGLVHGVMHADPHPGNFLFSDKGVTILDFGAVTTTPHAYMDHLSEAVDALRSGDDAALLDSVRRHGFLVGEGSPEGDQAVLRQYRHNFGPLTSDEPFKFTRAFLADNFRDVNRNVVKLGLPVDMIEPLRFGIGYASTLATLGSTARWGEIFAEIRTRRTPKILLASA